MSPKFFDFGQNLLGSGRGPWFWWGVINVSPSRVWDKRDNKMLGGSSYPSKISTCLSMEGRYFVAVITYKGSVSDAGRQGTPPIYIYIYITIHLYACNWNLFEAYYHDVNLFDNVTWHQCTNVTTPSSKLQVTANSFDFSLLSSRCQEAPWGKICIKYDVRHLKQQQKQRMKERNQPHCPPVLGKFSGIQSSDRGDFWA